MNPEEETKDAENEQPGGDQGGNTPEFTKRLSQKDDGDRTETEPRASDLDLNSEQHANESTKSETPPKAQAGVVNINQSPAEADPHWTDQQFKVVVDDGSQWIDLATAKNHFISNM